MNSHPFRRRDRLASVTALVFLVHLMQVFAQDSEPTPREPLLKRMPAASEWRCELRIDREKAESDFSNPKPDSTPSKAPYETMPMPREVVITKMEDRYREVTSWNNGQTTEKWIVGNLQIRTLRKSDRLMRVSVEGYTDDASDYSRSDFEDLEWIAMGNYRGVKTLNGRKVFCFSVEAGEKKLSPREKSYLPDNPDIAKRRCVAYLDIETQRPLYLDDGSFVRIYQYSQTPPVELSVPPRFQAEFDAWKQELGPLAAKRLY